MPDQQQCVIVLVIQLLIKNTWAQFPVPVYPAPFFPIQVAVAVPVEVTTTTTTTTTACTERPVAIAVPVPMPMPMAVQVAVPAPPPPLFCQQGSKKSGCPPCPPCVCSPSCTPSFFSYCSPCHQKCRCKNGSDAPAPIPLYPPPPVPGPAYPVPIPVPQPPLLMIPYPPVHRVPPRYPPRRPKDSSDSMSKDSSSSYDTSSSRERRRRRRNRIGKRYKRKHVYRRNMQPSDASNDELVKPVLTFVSKNGDVKIKRKLSKVEASRLIGENEHDEENFQLLTGHGRVAQPSFDFTDEDKMLSGHSDKRRKHVILKNGVTTRFMKDGKKKLIFKQPENKKLTDLAVSFRLVD